MANQRLNAIINIGGSVSKAFNSSIGTTQQRLEGVGDAIAGVERQQKRIDRFDIQGLRETRDRLKQARGEVSRLGDQLAESRRSTRQAEQAYTGAKDRVEQLADEMRRAESPSAVLRHDFEKAQAEAKRLGQEFQRAQRDTKSLAGEHRQSERHVEALNDQFETERRRLSEVRDELREAGVDTRNLGDESERLARRMERLQRRQRGWQNVGKSTARVGASFQRMNQEVGAFGRNAGVAGAAVSAAMGTVVHSYAQSTEEIDQWASRLGMSTSELSQWTGAGRQFGVQQDAMIDAFKEVSLRADEFIETGKGPAAEAFERLGLTGEQLRRVSDDTGAMMGMVLQRVREVDDAAARQRIVDEIFGGQGGEQMAELAAQSAEEINNLRREHDQLGATVRSLDGDQARDYMYAWRNAQNALIGVRNTFARQLLPLVTAGFATFSEYVKGNQDQIQAWAVSFTEGVENALPTVIEIGQGFWRASQMVGALVSQTANLVGGFDNLATIVGVALAGKAIASVFSFGTAIFGVGKALLTVTGAMPYLTAGIKTLGLAIAATPVGWIVGGITAIATAAYLIYRNWESVGPWLSNLWSGVADSAAAAWEWFRETLSWHPLALIADRWGGIADWFSGLWGDVRSVLSWSPIDAIERGWSGVGGLAQRVWGGVEAVAGAAWDKLKTVLSWSPVGLIAQAWSGADGLAQRVWGGVESATVAAWDGIKTILSWSPLGLIAQAWSGAGGLAQRVWGGVQSVAASAWEGLRSVLSWSPLELIAQAWSGVSGWFAGLWGGVMDNAQRAIDWIAGRLEWVGNAFSKASSWLGFGGGDDDEKTSGVGSTQRPSDDGGPARPDLVADVQPRAAGSEIQASSQRPPAQNITNNISLSVTAREGEGDASYARRITDMVIDELNDRQRGALYDG